MKNTDTEGAQVLVGIKSKLGSSKRITKLLNLATTYFILVTYMSNELPSLILLVTCTLTSYYFINNKKLDAS